MTIDKVWSEIALEAQERAFSRWLNEQSSIPRRPTSGSEVVIQTTTSTTTEPILRRPQAGEFWTDTDGHVIFPEPRPIVSWDGKEVVPAGLRDVLTQVGLLGYPADMSGLRRALRDLGYLQERMLRAKELVRGIAGVDDEVPV